jgi:predicted dehydrogenase
MEPVRFGVLGVSNHFIKRIAIPLAGSRTATVHGIASRDGAKARDTAIAWGIPRRYGSYEAMLEDTDIEAVYIPLPNHLHLEWIKNCADAGKHILCEKPLALSAEEAAESVEYAEKRGVRIMEAFMYRFHPQWRRALEIVRTGEIGPIRTIQTIFTYNNSNPSDIRNRLDVGGGGIRDIGCYAVSSARFLMQAEPVRAVSLVERDPVFGTDRLASAILDFGGARCVFTVGTQSWPAQQVDAYGASGSLTIEVPFNTFPDVPARLTVRVGIGLRTVETGPVDQYLLEFEAFARAVREGTEVPTPPADAVANQKVLDALFRSESSGGWESV